MTNTLIQAVSGLLHNPERVKAFAESINGTEVQQQQFIAQLKANFAPGNVKELLARWGIDGAGATAGGLNLHIHSIPTDLTALPRINKKVVEQTKSLNRK